MALELDYLEYATDALARAAYINDGSFDSFTKLCSHFDGADGATAYTDPIAGAYTFAGTAQLDTAQKVLGSASLLLDGNSDYVTVPDNANWNFGTGDFTIDCRVRFASLANDQMICGQYVDTDNYWRIYKTADPGNSLVFVFKVGGVVVANYNTSDGIISATNTWYHVVFERYGTTAKILVDGDNKSLTETVAFSTNDVGDLASLLYIGDDGRTTYFFNGWIDEFRISKGIARWTDDFTPDTEAYPIQSGYNLQCFSEGTIKQQGSYALKGIGIATGSLNKTLTKTLSPTKDASGEIRIKFDIRSSRTGSNIKLGFHDAGGTTTESTPNVLSANTWQTVNVDLSSVTNANKDALDSIIITIVNADAANTFYIDNIYVLQKIAASDYTIELRDKNGNLKQYLTPFASKVGWEWNRIGGCGRCSITIQKGYRDILFDAFDDIQIRVKSGSTSKLVYRGYLANIVPTLKVNQEITLDIRGYFDLLKKLVVQDTGDTKTYTTSKVSEIVDSIADAFIVANSSITKGTIEDGDYTSDLDTIDFLGNVDDALRTLAEIAGDIEYGVDENLIFYWMQEHTTLSKRFFVGNDVSVLERRVKWDDLVNKIYLVGGDVAGVKYKKTGENTDSQASYGLMEEVINNSSITSNGVAAQYITAILQERAIPQFSIRAQIKNIDLRLEDTIPLGLVSFYDAIYDRDSLGDTIGDIIGEAADGGSDITIGLVGDGGSDVTIGGQYSAQVDRISYTLSNTAGRFNLEIQLGDTILETSAKLKRLERELASVTQY